MSEISCNSIKSYAPKVCYEFFSHKNIQRRKFVKRGCYTYPVVENLLDKVVLNRSIPFEDGVATLIEIKNKFPGMKNYIDGCLESLQKYRKMI